uniref:Uncharacterized protein n=1 Tax=Caenorhabditis japonica TaxID=281687 RepID=A0A8R1IZL4_CAEJA
MVPHDQDVLGVSKKNFVDLLEFAEDRLAFEQSEQLAKRKERRAQQVNGQVIEEAFPRGNSARGRKVTNIFSDL